MHEQYIRERQADSLHTVVPIVSILIVTSGIGFLAFFMFRYWSLWLITAAAPLVGYWTWQQLKQGRHQLPGRVFIGAHLLLLAIVYADTWSPHSAIPFLYGLFVVISSLLLGLRASFVTWGASSILTLVVLGVGGQFTLQNAGTVAAAILFNLILAVATFLAAVDWKIALESVSLLQQKAQRRRDELYQMKEKLSQSNARLAYLNKELDEARKEALRERDLRTRFMNNVSHELRTPLNAVVNFAHILGRGGRGEVNDGQRDYLHRIEESGEHVLEVLNDLLDMAQIESGEFKLYRERTSLEPICEEAMTHLRGLVMDKEVDVVRDYPEEWPVVFVDKMRVKQALINLLGNAAKYTETGHIAMRIRPGSDHVAIMVEDTGVGIDPAHHELIFQEFRQLDETAARKRLGTGLGLPLTRHLLTRHGGTITVDSAPGQGSCFTISLPLQNGSCSDDTPAGSMKQTPVVATPPF